MLFRIGALIVFCFPALSCTGGSSSENKKKDDSASGGVASFSSGGTTSAGGNDSVGNSGNGGSPLGSGGSGTGGDPNAGCTDSGATQSFSFFVTSYHHMKELSGSEDGFGGDLRYDGATTGLEGADKICQEIAARVCHGHKTWRAYLSTSTVDAIDRIGSGPWHDYAGNLVADDPSGLTSDDRPAGGCCDEGIYDELGVFHDGKTDVNNDGQDDDDHDTMTATLWDGTYAGFSCDDWTSLTAVDEDSDDNDWGFPDLGSGLMLGHTWPAQSGENWSEAHAGHGCAAGTNFIQDGPGDLTTVGGGGGYGAIYCFAVSF